MGRLIIRNGTLLTASDTIAADLLVDGERIVAIGQGLPAGDAQEVDATGKLLLPGGIDPHTHFDLPMFGTVSSDDHYTGHKAAAFGGTTTVMDFVPQDPGQSLLAALEGWRRKAAKAAIDYSFHSNLSWLGKETLAELPKLAGEGVTSIKLFTAYNKRMRLQDGEIFLAMRACAEHGLLPMLHAENGDVIDIMVGEAVAAGRLAPEWQAFTRPAWGEAEATYRGIALAATAGAPLYVVHMTCLGALEVVCRAREQELPVMGETCPQYLFFTTDDLRKPDGAKWVCSPPVRTAEDNAALWRGLELGWLQVVGTDHCAFFYDGTRPIEYEGKKVAIPGKELGRGDFTKIPNGLPGVEDRMQILWTYGVGQGRITPHQFVALTSTNAAKAFGLYPQKGTLAPGADADIVIWNPTLQRTVSAARWHQRTDYNLYEGWQITGAPEQVYLRGRLIVDGDTWLGASGQGRFIERRSGTIV